MSAEIKEFAGIERHSPACLYLVSPGCRPDVIIPSRLPAK
jgi:hypothetical protein